MTVIVESHVCPGCGCLCDDLDVILEGEHIVQVNNVCLWGAGKFFNHKKFHPKKPRARITAPLVRSNDRLEPSGYERALVQAGQILRQARRPVYYGLTNMGSWAQEAALQLARRTQGRVEPGDLSLLAPYYQSLADYGLYWAPLEVIRDEADMVLFWGANPIHSSPRHVVRYSAFARGRFTECGHEDRQVAAVDIYPAETAKFCKPFVQIEPGQELALLQGIDEVLTGGPKSGPRIKGTNRLAKLLQGAGYGVIFFGRGVSYGPAAELLKQLNALVARLNQGAPFALFPLTGDFNSSGIYQLLLRETGSPYAPDFRDRGGCSHDPRPVDWRTADAIVVAGADLIWFLPEEHRQELRSRQVPIVVLSPFANQTTARAQVVLPTALAGIETDEVAYRMDGLPLALKKLVATELPPDYQVLQDLMAVV